MTIGMRIKQAREARKITRTQLVKLSGVPYPTLAGIENGDQAGSTRLHAIAAALQVRVEWLETGKGSMAQSVVPSQSHPTQLSPEMIAETHRALRLHDARRGKAFDIEAEPERFLQACSLWQQMPSAPTPENLIEFGMRLAEMAPQGALVHERNEDVPAAGAAGSAKRRRR